MRDRRTDLQCAVLYKADVFRETRIQQLASDYVRLALEMAVRAYIIEQGRVAGHGTGRSLLSDDRVRRAYLGYAPADPSLGVGAGAAAEPPSRPRTTEESG